MRFQLTAANNFLFIREGDLREVHNNEGEYIGAFAPMTVELEIVEGVEGDEKGKYLLNSFQAEGYGARSTVEQMIEKIRAKGSVNLTKWTKVPEDTRTFEERYLENMDLAEREDRFAESL